MVFGCCSLRPAEQAPDGSNSVALAAAEGPPPESPRITLSRLKNEVTDTPESTWEARLEAAKKLGTLAGTPLSGKAGRTLLPVLREDRHWQVRRQAAHSLRLLGADVVADVEPELRTAMQGDPDPCVQQAASLALAMHGCRVPGDGAVSKGVRDLRSFSGKGPAGASGSQTIADDDVSTAAGSALKGTGSFHSVGGRSAFTTTDSLLDGGVGECDPAVDVGATFEVLLTKDEVISRLGCDLDLRSGKSLKIAGVQDDGLVHRWNEQHPQRRVQAGDRIVEVNGRRNNVRLMLEAIKSERSLSLLVFRGGLTRV